MLLRRVTAINTFMQISCVSSSSALSDRLRYPRYFQLLTSEETMALGYYGVIREYGWRRVAFIVQDEGLFTVVRKLANTCNHFV
jgi:hypothetical protein